MLPIKHFIVAGIPLVAYTLLRDRQLPTPRVTALIFVGSQLPDLVDKPLAHQFGLLPSGRVGMHSLPIAVPLLALGMYYGWRTARLRLTGVFAAAHLVHLFGDNYKPLLDSPPTVSSDLIWPLAKPITRPAVPHWAGADGINILLWTVFSIAVLTFFGYVVLTDIRDHLVENEPV